MRYVDVSWLATYTAMSTGPQPSFTGSVMSTSPSHWSDGVRELR